MKALLIDVGHSFVKAALYEKAKRHLFCIPTADIENLKKHLGLKVLPDRILIASVAVQAKVLSKLFPNAIFVRNSDIPMKTCYSKSQLGVDRLLSSFAASQIYKKKAVIVVTLGTCTTIDLISSDNIHKGGLIMPGIDLMFDSLIRLEPKFTAKRKPYDKVPQTTAAAIRSGIFLSTAAAIECTCKSWSNHQPMLIISGGWAIQILPLIDYKPVEVRNQLVLEGLAHLATIV